MKTIIIIEKHKKKYVSQKKNGENMNAKNEKNQEIDFLKTIQEGKSALANLAKAIEEFDEMI